MSQARKTQTNNPKTKEDLRPSCTNDTIENLDYFCRGVVGLTTIAVGLSAVVGALLICGAVSRAIDNCVEVLH